MQISFKSEQVSEVKKCRLAQVIQVVYFWMLKGFFAIPDSLLSHNVKAIQGFHCFIFSVSLSQVAGKFLRKKKRR